MMERMTAKEFAARINGREQGKELTQEEHQLAKENGLVVIYGDSDDLMEVCGALDLEFDCYKGRSVYLNRSGDVDPLYTDCPHYLRSCDMARKEAAEIKAVWYDVGNPSWAYETGIPHEAFAVMDYCDPTMVFCIGIVFSVEDLPNG